MDLDKLTNELMVSGRLISGLKVAELKEELKARGQRNSGNKAQLQELLVAAVLREQTAQFPTQIQLQNIQTQNIQHVPLPEGIVQSVPITENVMFNSNPAGGDSYSVVQNADNGVKLIIRSSPTKGSPTKSEYVVPPPQPVVEVPVSVPVQPEPVAVPEPTPQTPAVVEVVTPQAPEVVSPVPEPVVPEPVVAPTEPQPEPEPESLPESQPEPETRSEPEPETVVQQVFESAPAASEAPTVAEDVEMKVTAERAPDTNDISMGDNTDNNTSSLDNTSSQEDVKTRSGSPKLTIRPRKLTLQRSQNQETEASQTDKTTTSSAIDKRPKWGSKRDSNAQKGITSNELKQIIDESKLLEDSNNQKVGKTEGTLIKADLSLEDSSNTEPSASARLSQDSAGTSDSNVGPQATQGSSISESKEEDSSAPDVRPKSPAKNAPSCILHILGLARPYTVTSLKRLLTKFGKIDDTKFWTDKKRSECYAVYTCIEDAQKTREHLHGLRWPISSPNTLSVDFETEENLERCLNQPEEIIPKRQDENKNGLADNSKYDIIKNDVDKGSSGAAKGSALTKTIREWDRNKEDVGSKRKRDDSRSRSPSPKRKERRQISPDRRDGKRRDSSAGRNSPRRERSGPAPTPKMDDLFKKTVAQPHIYYKPLNDEEAKLRDIELRSRPRPPPFMGRKGGRFGDRRRRSPPAFRRDRSFSPVGRRGGPPGGFRSGGRFRSPPRRSSPGPYRRSPMRRGMSPPMRRGMSPPSRRPLSPPRRGMSPPFSRRGGSPRRGSSPSHRRGRGSPPRRRSPQRYRR